MIPSSLRSPRSIFLTAMIAVVALLLARGSKRSAQEATDAVRDAVGAMVVAAQERPREEFVQGQLAADGTEPAVSAAFATWVAGRVPAGAASTAAVHVEPADRGWLGQREGEATHRVTVDLRGGRAELDVVCDGARRRDGQARQVRMIAFRAADAGVGDAATGRGASGGRAEPTLPPR